VSSTACSGLGYEVKDSGNDVKCTGTLSGSDACPSSWSTATGMQNYNLYVAGKLNDTKSADCPSCTCDSTSYTACASALALTSGAQKSAMCGDQFYKITVTGSGTCDLTWTLTPDSNADYDLATSWTSGTCSSSIRDCESANGIGSVDTCARTALAGGTYYAFVKKSWTETSSAAYKIKATLSNCRTPGRNLAVQSITVPSPVYTNSIASVTVVVRNVGETTENVVFTVS